MTKWIKRIVIVFIALLLVFVIVGNWFLKEAFGPKHRKVEIKLDDKSTLIGNETYNADMAAVFYDVNFTLRIENAGSYKLGNGTYANEQWDKNIRLYSIADWIILPVTDGSYSKILLKNKATRPNKDTILSPQNLRYDSLWKASYSDIPAWVNYGSSIIDTIKNNRLFISYEYRIGDYQPFKFYTQTLEYSIDTITGDLKTTKVFERQEKKKGS